MQKRILCAFLLAAAINHARSEPPVGFAIPENTISPDKLFGVLVPDEKRYEAVEKNKPVEVSTGRELAVIAGEPGGELGPGNKS